jgi:hypothetical protein
MAHAVVEGTLCSGKILEDMKCLLFCAGGHVVA